MISTAKLKFIVEILTHVYSIGKLLYDLYDAKTERDSVEREEFIETLKGSKKVAKKKREEKLEEIRKRNNSN